MLTKLFLAYLIMYLAPSQVNARKGKEVYIETSRNTRRKTSVNQEQFGASSSDATSYLNPRVTDPLDQTHVKNLDPYFSHGVPVYTNIPEENSVPEQFGYSGMEEGLSEDVLEYARQVLHDDTDTEQDVKKFMNNILLEYPSLNVEEHEPDRVSDSHNWIKLEGPSQSIRKKCFICHEKHKDTNFRNCPRQNIKKVTTICDNCRTFQCANCFQKIHKLDTTPTLATTPKANTVHEIIPSLSTGPHHFTRAKGKTKDGRKLCNMHKYYFGGKVQVMTRCETCNEFLCPYCHQKKHGLPNPPEVPKEILDPDAEQICAYCNETIGLGSNEKAIVHHTRTCTRIPRCETLKYACYAKDCGYDCNSSDSIKSHVRIRHTGFRPYKCSTCGSAFKERALLRKHIKDHLKENNK